MNLNDNTRGMMKPTDITNATVKSFLHECGLTEAMLFGKEEERADPIDRHVWLRNVYQHFTDYKMKSDGLTLIDPKNPSIGITHPNMKDFDEIQTLDDCVVNMKFLCYARDIYLSKAREKMQRTQSMERDEFER